MLDPEFLPLPATDEKTVFLFKIFRKKSDPEFFGQRFPLFVDLGGHLGRADGQRRSHVCKTMLTGISEGFFQPESETDRTARPSFRFPFQTTDGCKPAKQVIWSIHYRPGEFFSDLDQFPAAEFMLGRGLDIGIVKKSPLNSKSTCSFCHT